MQLRIPEGLTSALATANSRGVVSLLPDGAEQFLRGVRARAHGQELRQPKGLPEGHHYDWMPATGLEKYIPPDINGNFVELLNKLPPKLVVGLGRAQNRLFGGTRTEQGIAGAAVHEDPRAYRIDITADVGSGLPEEKAVADTLRGLDGRALIMNGDLAYPTGREQDFAQHFDPFYGNWPKPILPSVGNHEVMDMDLRAMFKRFPQLQNQTYYKHSMEDLDLFFLDTEQSLARGSKQRVWADRELAASGAKYKVIVGHRPAYASNSKGEAAHIRSNVPELAEQHNVPLVINGHDHVWERTKPINGVTYVVTGGGGALEAPLMGALKPWSAYRNNGHHYARLSVGPEGLVIRAYGLDGKLMDTGTVTANAVADAKRGALAGNVVHDHSVTKK